MSSLPPDLDFEADKAASPARMNRAMTAIATRLVALELPARTFDQVLAELQAIGLQRIADALAPVYDRLTTIDALGGLAPLDTPAFTGLPSAPTPAAGDATTRIATAAFVQAAVATAVAALIGGADGAGDTLKKLADRVVLLTAGAPALLDSFMEVAAKLADDDSQLAGLLTALGLRLRFDAFQDLTAAQRTQGLANLGAGVPLAVVAGSDFTTTYDPSYNVWTQMLAVPFTAKAPAGLVFGKANVYRPTGTATAYVRARILRNSDNAEVFTARSYATLPEAISLPITALSGATGLVTGTVYNLILEIMKTSTGASNFSEFSVALLSG